MSSGDGDNDDMDGDILLPLPPHVLDDTRAPEDAEGAEAEEGHTRSKVSGSTDAGAVNGEGTDVESACAEIEATSADNAEVSEAGMMTEINTPSEEIKTPSEVGTKGGVQGEETDAWWLRWVAQAFDALLMGAADSKAALAFSTFLLLGCLFLFMSSVQLPLKQICASPFATGCAECATLTQQLSDAAARNGLTLSSSDALFALGISAILSIGTIAARRAHRPHGQGSFGFSCMLLFLAGCTLIKGVSDVSMAKHCVTAAEEEGDCIDINALMALADETEDGSVCGTELSVLDNELAVSLGLGNSHRAAPTPRHMTMKLADLDANGCIEAGAELVAYTKHMYTGSRVCRRQRHRH